MLITLVRDNIPAKAEAEGVKLKATTAQHNDLFANLLNERLIESVSAYISGGNLDALVETQIIIESLTDLLGDRYKELYTKQVEDLGTYAKRYVVVQMQSASNASTEAETSQVKNDKV